MKALKNIVKQLFSFILPVTVLIIVPKSIEDNFEIGLTLISFIGIILILLGLFILVSTIITFIRIGKGTLAPWSPTRKLIIGGMYGHVRNPMITGVFAVLIGEALTFSSLNIFYWSLTFFLINNIYFIMYEEPNLEKRFGEEYREYKQNVPRWFPKHKSFKPKE